MPLPQSLTGMTFGPREWRADTRSILAYRAAMTQEDLAGLDDLRPGFAALPTHVATPEWLLTTDILKALSASLTPAEAMRGVHVSQDTTFHLPIRPGDLLATDAEVAGVRQTRSGAILACVCTTRRHGDGATVARSVAATLYRDVVCADGGVVPPPPPMDVLSDEKAAAHLALPPGFAHLYAACADIHNPIHTERGAARAAGLDDIIVQGSALWAKAGLAIAALRADGDASTLRRLTARFLAPVRAGEALDLRLRKQGPTTFYALVRPDGVAATAGEASLAG